MPSQTHYQPKELSQALTLGKFLEYMAPFAKVLGVHQEGIGVLKQDVSVLKKDVSQLKEDVVDLRQDLNSFKEEMREFRSEMMDALLTFKDEMMGEFKKMHEIMAAGQYRQSEHSDQLEDHEKRLFSLENKNKIN